MEQAVNSKMRGLQLPLNAVVVLLISIFVAMAVGSFFIFSSGQQTASTEAQQIYATSCQQFCKNGFITTVEVVDTVVPDKKFLQACKINGVQAGIYDSESATYCIKACPCEIASDLDAHKSDLADMLNSKSY